MGNWVRGKLTFAGGAGAHVSSAAARSLISPPPPPHSHPHPPCLSLPPAPEVEAICILVNLPSANSQEVFSYSSSFFQLLLTRRDEPTAVCQTSWLHPPLLLFNSFFQSFYFLMHLRRSRLSLTFRLSGAKQRFLRRTPAVWIHGGEGWNHFFCSIFFILFFFFYYCGCRLWKQFSFPVSRNVTGTKAHQPKSTEVCI